MLLVCYNLLNSQNVATYQSIISEKWLDTSDVAKNAAEVAQKKEQQLAHGEVYP